MARPTKYTPETIKAILDAITLGGSDKDACVYGGVDQDTFLVWMKRYPDFSEKVTYARTAGKLQRIGRIKKHGENDWRADAWYLERRWPEEYAQQLIIKVQPADAAILKKNGLTASEAWEMLMQNLSKVTEGGNS